ncbi:Beta-galactosidase 1, partial [Striga hermonthica]
YHGGTNFGMTAGGPFIALAMTVMHLLMNMSYNEEAASHEENSFTMVGLLEHINNTRDDTVYLWYTTDVRTDSNKGFVSGGKLLVLAVLSASHALNVFINKHLSECGPSFRGVECCRS